MEKRGSSGSVVVCGPFKSFLSSDKSISLFMNELFILLQHFLSMFQSNVFNGPNHQIRVLPSQSRLPLCMTVCIGPLNQTLPEVD